MSLIRALAASPAPSTNAISATSKTFSFDLLAGLHANNNKEWFDAHRDDFRDALQSPFEHVLLAADGGFVAAGFHQLPTPKLTKIRERPIDDEKAFAKILSESRRGRIRHHDLRGGLRCWPRESQNPVIIPIRHPQVPTRVQFDRLRTIHPTGSAPSPS